VAPYNKKQTNASHIYYRISMVHFILKRVTKRLRYVSQFLKIIILSDTVVPINGTFKKMLARKNKREEIT
jgi:hypothetical protein